MFLLSEKEVKTCFPDKESRKALPSEYAREQGAAGGPLGSKEYADWWILPQYERGIYPKAVLSDGEIRFHGKMAFYKNVTIRPCIQINLAVYQNIEAKGRKITGGWRNKEISPYGYDLV